MEKTLFTVVLIYTLYAIWKIKKNIQSINEYKKKIKGI